MTYDFDKYIERRGTNSVKYDLNRHIFGTDELLPMWVADMDFEVPDFIREAILKRAGHPVYGYTFRPRSFFEATASWLFRRQGWEINPDSISFSPGIVPAVSLCIQAFTSPGDNIVVQSPVYFPFFNMVTKNKRQLVHNQLVEHNGEYGMDFDQLEAQFRSGASMFVLCHPHNPVGRVWKREELETLANLCLKYKVLVLSDEIHSDLVLFGNKHIPFASLGQEVADQTITFVAPSKTFNLAGLHTSLVVATNSGFREKYEHILDVVHVGGGNLFGQVALEAAYTHGDTWVDQLISYLEQNYNRLCSTLSQAIPGMVISPLEATYLVWLDFSFLKMEDGELKRFIINEARLGLNDGPMFGPGGEQHQRINIATSWKVLDQGLKQLSDAVQLDR